jgi:hypothetical protein
MRLTIVFLLASILCPSVVRAQAQDGIPVFTFMHEGSAVKFSVKASVANRVEVTVDLRSASAGLPWFFSNRAWKNSVP